MLGFAPGSSLPACCAVSPAVSRAGGSAPSAIERRFATWTPRERGVLWLMVTGMLTQQIAGELGIAEKTAKIHRVHVTQKMEACSVAQLLPMARKLGSPGSGPS